MDSRQEEKCCLCKRVATNLALPDSYARAVRDGSEGVWGKVPIPNPFL